MKQIINGKKYDTETAVKVAEYSFGYPSDFQHVSEELYRKRTGEYFIHGEGGPASKYSHMVSYNETSGSEKILPLTREEAMEWAEEHMDGDAYEAEFGQVEEPEPELKWLGDNIRQARGDMTQTDAAKRCGITQQLWARYELGQIDPTVSRLIQIAKALNISAAELIKQ